MRDLLNVDYDYRQNPPPPLPDPRDLRKVNNLSTFDEKTTTPFIKAVWGTEINLRGGGSKSGRRSATQI
jgi:hypothetical protein